MIYLSLVFLNKTEILEIQVIPFEEDSFELKSFLNNIDSQEKISDYEPYIKVQVWIQNHNNTYSELAFEKEFINGEVEKNQKNKKEGVILNFPSRFKKDKYINKGRKLGD